MNVIVWINCFVPCLTSLKLHTGAVFYATNGEGFYAPHSILLCHSPPHPSLLVLKRLLKGGGGVEKGEVVWMVLQGWKEE